MVDSFRLLVEAVTDVLGRLVGPLASQPEHSASTSGRSEFDEETFPRIWMPNRESWSQSVKRSPISIYQ